MKLFLTSAILGFAGLFSEVSAQYYGGSTYNYGGGYNSTQNYRSSKGNTTVRTQRNYNPGGGYSSSTQTYRNGSPSTYSNTYRDPWGNTTTTRYNNRTGRTTTTYKSRY